MSGLIVMVWSVGSGEPAHREQIVADGGRNAYRGLRYQYLRTLEALMAAVEEPALGIIAVHIEGMPGRDGGDRDSVDYELSDASGRAERRLANNR
jgi:hypothetical protein